MTPERRDSNDGVLANKMGIGKTMSALLMYILERWLELVVSDINKDRDDPRVINLIF